MYTLPPPRPLSTALVHWPGGWQTRQWYRARMHVWRWYRSSVHYRPICCAFDRNAEAIIISGRSFQRPGYTASRGRRRTFQNAQLICT